MTSRTYQTRMRVLPDGEWHDVTVTEYDSFAQMPGWKNRPKAESIPLRDLTPGELAQAKDMSPAEFRKLARKVDARKRKTA